MKGGENAREGIEIPNDSFAESRICDDTFFLCVIDMACSVTLLVFLRTDNT